MSGLPKVVAFSKWPLVQSHRSHPPFYFFFPASLLHVAASLTGLAACEGFGKAWYQLVALGIWKRCRSAASQLFKRVRKRPVWCAAETGRFYHLVLILIGHYEESTNSWLTVKLWCRAFAWRYVGKIHLSQLIEILTWNFSTYHCFFYPFFFLSVLVFSFSFTSSSFIFHLYYL